MKRIINKTNIIAKMIQEGYSSREIERDCHVSSHKVTNVREKLSKQFKREGKNLEYTIENIRLSKKILKEKNLKIHTSLPIRQYKPIDWNVAKSLKTSSKIKKPFKTYLIIADTHIPFENIPAVKSVLNLMNDILFDGFIILGDFMDMSPLSHWLHSKKKRRSLENKRMKLDYIEGNKLLDEFDKRLSKTCDKRFFYGNHERFWEDFIEEFPVIEDYLEPKEELQLNKRNYTVYPVNHIEKIGRLHLLHGMYHNQNYVKQHIDKMKVNVLHADMHSPRFRCSESIAREIAMVGYCLGCLCDLAPKFLKGRANKWSHGFAVAYFYEDGYFDVDLKRIVKGKFVFNNKLYDGNK